MANVNLEISEEVEARIVRLAERPIDFETFLFIDQQKKRVRVLRKCETGYVETLLTGGELALESVPGFVLHAEWLFAETRPDRSDLLHRLLSA